MTAGFSDTLILVIWTFGSSSGDISALFSNFFENDSTDDVEEDDNDNFLNSICFFSGSFCGPLFGEGDSLVNVEFFDGDCLSEDCFDDECFDGDCFSEDCFEDECFGGDALEDVSFLSLNTNE